MTRRRNPTGEARHEDAYYNPEFHAHAVKVLLGEHRLSGRPDEMLVTTLGSCVAACVRDPVLGIGGMNHFLLPEVPSGTRADVATRYGSVAMERLINAVLARGGRRERLEVKVFGGARMFASSNPVGVVNADFVLDFIEREGLALVGQDLGGDRARRVHYFPHSGRAMRKLLQPEALSATINRELRYLSDLRRKPVEGDIELFED